MSGKPNAVKRLPRSTEEPVVGTIISEEDYERSRQPQLPTLSNADIKAYSQLRAHSKAIGIVLLLGCLSAALLVCAFIATVVLPGLAPDYSSRDDDRSGFGNQSMHHLHLDSAEQLAEDMRMMRGRRSIDDMNFDHEQFDKQFNRDLNDRFVGDRKQQPRINQGSRRGT